MTRASALLTRIGGLSRNQRRAAIASFVWVVVVVSYGVGFFDVTRGEQSPRTMFIDGLFFLVALVLPLLLVWLAAWLADELARQGDIIAALAEVAAPLIETMRDTSDTLRSTAPMSPQDVQKAVQGSLLGAHQPDLRPTLDQIMAAQTDINAGVQALLERALAQSASPTRAIPSAPAQEIEDEPTSDSADTPATDSGTEPAAALDPNVAFGLGWPDLIRALDFPRDADDREGFRALQAALNHPRLAQMLQAAEDVLNLLSQEGAFVDDVVIENVDPEAWRRFITGVRGPEVASVGGISDPDMLARADDLMKSSSIFRDTALFFQRRFDVVLHEFGANASDAQLADMANTRSGRAFMLLARLSGSFD